MFCIFGRGSRACIGQDLAWMILQKAVAAVSTISAQLKIKSNGLTRPQVVRKWSLLCGEEALKGKAFFEMHYDELLVTLTPRA